MLELITAHLETSDPTSHYSAHKTTMKYVYNPDLKVQIIFGKFKEFYKENPNRCLTFLM